VDIRDDIKFYGKLAQRKGGYVAGQIEVTSDCYQNCHACDSWKAHKTGVARGTLTMDDVVNICRQLSEMPTFEHLSFTGGDPQKWFLESFLLNHRDRFHFSLQVNTALAVDGNWELYRRGINRLRVSLDGVTKATYQKMRGVQTNPEDVLERMELLGRGSKNSEGISIATNTCVSDRNIDEVPLIIKRLNKMKNPPRKAMFLAVLGLEVGKDFWDKFAKLKEISSPKVPTSFSEDVEWVRKFTKSEHADSIPCYAGGITFHIKCDGDVYPCCLTGGEAIAMHPEFVMGNALSEPLSEISKRYRPTFHYKGKKGPCVSICQYKQLQLNRAADEASKTMMTMP